MPPITDTTVIHSIFGLSGIYGLLGITFIAIIAAITILVVVVLILKALGKFENISILGDKFKLKKQNTESYTDKKNLVCYGDNNKVIFGNNSI